MVLRLLDKLAQNLLVGFDAVLVSESDLAFEGSDEATKGVNASILMNSNEDALDRLDSKAGSLLTHISMMVAAASFMVTASDSSTLERIVIGVEITGYLFFALLCLRCLAFRDLLSTNDRSTNSGIPSDYRRMIRREVLLRSKLLNISIRWVFLITFIFLLSIFVHLVL